MLGIYIHTYIHNSMFIYFASKPKMIIFVFLEHKIDRIMEDFNIYGSKEITLKEFVTIIHKLRENQDTEEVRAAFKVIDQNGDGKITPAEFKGTMKNIGLKLSDGQLSVMIEQADVNGDGVIDYKEFMAVMAKYCPQSHN